MLVLLGVHHVPTITSVNVGFERPAPPLQMVTDSLFACATRNATLSGPVKSSAYPVYLYRFDHVMSFGAAVWGANYSFCDDKVGSPQLAPHQVHRLVFPAQQLCSGLRTLFGTCIDDN